jgi:hypothetical protein
MLTRRRLTVGIGWSTFLAAVLTLSGCSGAFRVYDESRAKMATGIKVKYDKADVLGAIEVEKKNLDNLLAEELKVVRDNQQLRVDYALLRLADGTAPMAVTYRDTALARIKKLGFADPKALRADRLRVVDLTIGTRELQDLARTIKALAKIAPPPCRTDADLPEALAPTPSLAPDERADAEFFYATYLSVCKNVRANAPAHAAGDLEEAFKDWTDARNEVARLDQSVEAADNDAKEKSKAYQEALEKKRAAANAGEAAMKEAQEKAAAALKAFEKAKDIAKVISDKGTAEERLDSLVVLLSAAAGGTITTSDERLKKAATVAKEIPSLAGEMTALLENAKAPTVNGLLIEMRHQILLLELVKQLRGFAQQRADILKARYDALKEEARLWLRFTDATCSYAVVKPDGPFPGDKCDAFVVTIGSDNSVTCRLDSTPIAECRLGRSWNTNIRDRANVPATRELYKALAAYLQALAIQGAQHEQTFRLIDVGHREALANREAALRGWDNLVAVPIGQLDAFYQAGLKPAEIADLIVKALGFTAIAVGVAR